MSTDRDLLRSTMHDLQTEMAEQIAGHMEDGQRVPFLDIHPEGLADRIIGRDPDRGRLLLEALLYETWRETYSMCVVPGYATRRMEAERLASDFFQDLTEFTVEAEHDIDRITEEGKP